MFSTTWHDLLFSRFFAREPEPYNQIVRKFHLYDVKERVLDLPEDDRFEFITYIESLRNAVVIKGWIVDYNPFLKVLTFTPELELNATQQLQQRNMDVLDTRISNHIHNMSPFAFEEFVVDLLRSSRNEDGTKKYSRVSLSKKTRDGGKDFKAYFFDENNVRRVMFGEVKQWSKPIDEKVIDRLSKTMERESQKSGKAPYGIVVSLLGASPIARRTAETEHIEVWDVYTLVRLVKKNGLGVKSVSVVLPDLAYWSEYDEL